MVAAEEAPRNRTTARAFRAGLAFESQVVPEVPVEPHDVPLDAVITEARVLLAGHGPG